MAELRAIIDHSGIEDNALQTRSMAAVRNEMKDPESAKFRNINVVAFESGKLVCGEVNAKNGYGGYVGFEPFVASPRDVIFLDTSRYSEEGDNAGLFAACGAQS